MAVFAEPLDLVLIAKRAESGKFRDARIEPPERIGEFEGDQRLEFVAIAEGDQARL